MSTSLGDIQLVTFNVLHPIHGQNWNEFMMRASDYSEARRLDEFERLLRVLIEERCEGTLLVVALQEVSFMHAERARKLVREFHGASADSDYAPLAELRDGKRRAGYAGPPVMPECVMLLLFDDEPLDRQPMRTGNAAFASSQWNGYVYVDVPSRNLTVVSTHVSYGQKRVDQLAELATVAQTAVETRGATTCLVTGDFNCTIDTLRRQWPPLVSLAGDDGTATTRITLPSTMHGASAPTRIGKFGASSLAAAETIDHVVVVGQSLSMFVVRVIETDTMMLSDHRPVMFLFE